MHDTTPTILKLEDIHHAYPGPRGSVPVLHGVEMSLHAGDYVALCGPSGCGKSTLLSIAGGLLTPDRGSVEINGQPFSRLSSGRRGALRARQVGFVFQRFHLLPYLSVADNVRAAAVALAQPVSPQRLDELLEQVGLEQRRHHRPSQLSVGEQQRVAVARALANGPSLLLADEPTGNLDAHNAGMVWRAFASFAAAGGAVLMVTHDPAAAAAAQRQLQMTDGRIAPEAVAATS